MRIHFLLPVFLLVSLAFPGAVIPTYGQPDLPELDHLALEPDHQLLILLGLYYDASNRLTFDCGGKTYLEIDSLRPYLLAELREREVIARMRITVALMIDPQVKMEDVEGLQEELKRFDLLKVLFVGKSAADKSDIPDWNRGLYYKLPERDRKNIHLFFQSRQLSPKRRESLVFTVAREEEQQRKKERTSEGERMPPPFPPPPPPPPGPPFRYDPETMGHYPEWRSVVIKISGTDKYHLDQQSISEANLSGLIRERLAGGKRLFVLRTEATTTYGKYVKVFDSILGELHRLRQGAAREQFSQEYQDLGFAAVRQVNRQFPFVLINEPLYYRAGN